MKFKKITIENFRNFEYAELDLYNKNIIFGRNDFGKTNFLHALRFLFDPSIRNKGFQLSDYHKRNKDQPIKIVLELDVSEDSNDNKFIRARVHGAMVFSEGPLYIQLEGDFDQSKQLGNPVLKWGGSLNELEEINQRGIYSDLDRIFEVVYLSPNLSPKELFDKHRGLLYKNKKTNKNVEIEKSIKDLNELIGSDERVKSIGTQLSEKYNDIRKENIEIKLKSEHEVNGIFNHLTPYIQDLSLDDEHLYPTAGDGRQKILAYALTNLIEELKLEEKSDLRIPIYLMEEIENSLHPSMQQVISRHLFQTNVQAYPYLFITTHSEHLFVYMDDVNLIRIYKQEGAKLENKSMFFQVPNAFNAIRKIYNETLSQAFFYDRVLLVEGMSEKILFEAVIEKLIMEENYINPTFLEKAKILSIEGIGFKDYVTILDALGINVMIKTDNDIRKVKTKEEVSLLGINRCRELNAKMNHSDVVVEKEVFAIPDGLQHDVQKDKEKIKRKVFEEFKDEIDQWKENKIYLSEVELEEDLKGVLSSAVTGHSMFEGGFVAYLQEAKKKNMNEFVSQFLDADNAKEIINSERFSCLKNLVGDELNEN